MIGLQLEIVRDSINEKMKLTKCQKKGVTETYIEKFPGVFVSIIDSNSSSANSDIKTNSEVGWLEWHFGAVLLQYHLPVKEGSLRSSTVDHLWFCYQNGSVFEEVVNAQFSNSVIL